MVNEIQKVEFFCKRFLTRSTRKSNPITTAAAIALPSPMSITSILVVYCYSCLKAIVHYNIMKKIFNQQIVFAVALAVIGSLFTTVQAQTSVNDLYYNPVLSEDGAYITGLPMPDIVLQQKDTTTYKQGIYWHNSAGFWVWAETIDGHSRKGEINNASYYLLGQDCYVQDYDKVTDNIGGFLELRAQGSNYFWGKSLFIGVNTYLSDPNNPDSIQSTFTKTQMRFSTAIDATDTSSTSIDATDTSDTSNTSNLVYDPTKATLMDNIYLGNGWISNRLTENQNTYAVVGLTGTLYILPDPTNDDVFRSEIRNENRNRHIVIDSDCKIICPEGAKLQIFSKNLDESNDEHPFALFPVLGNIEGNGQVRYFADREDIIYVLGDNNDFTGTTRIQTLHTNFGNGNPSDLAFVVSGNGLTNSGIKGSEIIIETGNLILQNNHILNNLSSVSSAAAETRIGGSDAVTTNPFVADYHYPDDHDKTETLTLFNSKETTYYGSISGAHEQTVTRANNSTYNNWVFTGYMKEIIKDGNETLNLYVAGSDGGISAESFVVSSGRINFNGYFKSKADTIGLNVKAGAIFSPDSWGWGNDSAIVNDKVIINGNVSIDAGGRMEFNFSDYNTMKHDVIQIGDDGVNYLFDTSVSATIDLKFMNSDPFDWATENAKYLLVQGGGFLDQDYSYMLTRTYGNMQTLRQFGLQGENGNLYLITRYYVPEPSTWALLSLGAAGLLFWRKKAVKR